MRVVTSIPRSDPYPRPSATGTRTKAFLLVEDPAARRARAPARVAAHGVEIVDSRPRKPFPCAVAATSCKLNSYTNVVLGKTNKCHDKTKQVFGRAALSHCSIVNGA